MILGKLFLFLGGSVIFWIRVGFLELEDLCLNLSGYNNIIYYGLLGE